MGKLVPSEEKTYSRREVQRSIDVDPLPDALSKLVIFAQEEALPSLATWANTELRGYPIGEALPSYRAPNLSSGIQVLWGNAQADFDHDRSAEAVITAVRTEARLRLHEVPARVRVASGPEPKRSLPEPLALPADLQVTLHVENFRGLRQVTWTLPRGVSVLVGANGSGKSTLLDLLQLLRHSLERDVRVALDARGGPADLRHRDAPADALPQIGISLNGEAQRWMLTLSPSNRSPLSLELAQEEGKSVLAHYAEAKEARLTLPSLCERSEGRSFLPLLHILGGYRLYHGYTLSRLRQTGSRQSSETNLLPDGENLFSVLSNWRLRKDMEARYRFVMDSLGDAFPGHWNELQFARAGQTVGAEIVGAQPDQTMSISSVADGWLVALLHLTAVASTEPGGIVALDEPENGLHPYAIRSLIGAFRSFAEEHKLSILLSTHSPVLLDQFKETPSAIFVMEAGAQSMPISLDQLCNPEWLAQFSLGYLFAQERYGAPVSEGGDR